MEILDCSLRCEARRTWRLHSGNQRKRIKNAIRDVNVEPWAGKMTAVKDNKPRLRIHEDVTRKKRVSRVLKFHYRGEMRSVHENDSLSVIFSPAFLPALTRPPVGECLRRTPRAFAAATELSASLSLSLPFSLSLSAVPGEFALKGAIRKTKGTKVFAISHSEQITKVASFFSILIVFVLREMCENWWQCSKGISIAKANLRHFALSL